MELKTLSQNWKKLQETLKRGNSSSPAKRELPEQLSKPGPYSKRRRTDSQEIDHSRPIRPPRPPRITKMSTGDCQLSASVASWAGYKRTTVEMLQGTNTNGLSLKPSSLSDVSKDAVQLNGGLSATAETGKYIAMDCEMVGVGPNPQFKSALARVSIVNYHGDLVYDSIVKTKEDVTDYRTSISGITPKLMESARSFEQVQSDVQKILNGRILVGHGLSNDFGALMLNHPRKDVRDTSNHPPFRQYNAGNKPSLKLLASEVLGVEIQGGAHSSIEDARACMLLYKRDKDLFEAEHSKRSVARQALPVPAPSKNLEDSTIAPKNKRNKKKKKKHR